MSILIITDFKGDYKLSEFASNEDRINEQIDIVERKILDYLLGVDLKDEFTTALESPTPDQKWIDLRDGKKYTYNETAIRFDGVKKMLIPFTYAEIVDKDYFDSPQGVIQQNADAGNRIQAHAKHMLVKNAYNDGVAQYKNAQLFIDENIDDYPNWSTKHKTFMKW